MAPSYQSSRPWLSPPTGPPRLAVDQHDRLWLVVPYPDDPTDPVCWRLEPKCAQSYPWTALRKVKIFLRPLLARWGHTLCGDGSQHDDREHVDWGRFYRPPGPWSDDPGDSPRRVAAVGG